MLPDEVRDQVVEAFADLKSPVRLVIFTQTLECMYCSENRQLLEEIAGLSDMVSTEVYNFVVDGDTAKEHSVDKIPAVAIMGEEDYGIRFYGIPAGYEFTTLVHTIRMVGGAGSQLDEETREQLAALTEPVHLMVFVTPTCPYCPQAVVAAYEMAYASPMVRADGIESSEFPHLAVKYQVAGVPRTIINETVDIEGAVPPAMILEKIQEVLASPSAEKE
jgi:glutaredoxin-like protein